MHLVVTYIIVRVGDAQVSLYVVDGKLHDYGYT